MKKRLAVFVATWFYSGFTPPIAVPAMGGTYGSLFALPLCYALIAAAAQGAAAAYWAVLMLVFLLSLWSIPIAEAALGPRTDWRGKTKTRDQNQIAIDEVFGMLIACFPLALSGIPPNAYALGGAFFLFRFFDIAKVPPAHFFDAMKNPLGVIMDDAVAGAYTALALYFVSALF